MTAPRRWLRARVIALVGERPVPVGGVAAQRRALRRALAGTGVGEVLVVGPGLAARQALPGVRVDVAGTSPHSYEVTVCSAALGAASLPPGRWDTVVVTDPGPDLPARLEAVRAACRPGALVALVARGPAQGPPAALSSICTDERVTGSAAVRVWTGRVLP